GGGASRGGGGWRSRFCRRFRGGCGGIPGCGRSGWPRRWVGCSRGLRRRGRPGAGIPALRGWGWIGRRGRARTLRGGGGGGAAGRGGAGEDLVARSGQGRALAGGGGGAVVEGDVLAGGDGFALVLLDGAGGGVQAPAQGQDLGGGAVELEAGGAVLVGWGDVYGALGWGGGGIVAVAQPLDQGVQAAAEAVFVHAQV